MMLQAGCIYLGLITPSPETFHPVHLPQRLTIPCPKTFHPYTCPKDLSLPAQLQMPSQVKYTQNILPNERFPYRFHKPPYKYRASLIPLRTQPGR